MRGFRSLYALLVLGVFLAGCGSGEGNDPPPPNGKAIAVNSTDLFFSPYNWYRNGATYAETTQPGAYIRLGFTGRNAWLSLDLTPLVGVPTSSWPKIRWQIDGGAPRNHQITIYDRYIRLSGGSLGPGSHFVTVAMVADDMLQDRWVLPAETVRITGMVLDPDGASVPSTPRPRQMVFLGDSITEGIRTESDVEDWYRDNDGTHAYTAACAAALNAEFGVIGTPGQGWTVAPSSNPGSVPALPGSWSDYFHGSPRVFSPPPDYVVAMEGTNDVFAAADPNRVSRAVQDWLGNVRSALPTSRIFLTVEFGGFERDAVTAGFHAYQATAHDASTYLIDLGPSAQTGLTGFVKGGTAQSYDGVHPNAAMSQVLGQQLAAAIQAAIHP